MNIHSKLPEVGTTIFTVMSALAQEHGAINLSQGFPNFEVDQDLKDLVDGYVQEGYNQYAPMTGIPELRHAIADKKQLLYGCKLDPNQEITITNGATEAIYSAISALIKAGDEVIIFEPAYDSYSPAIKVNGGIVRPIRAYAPDYRINWNEVADCICESTKMIIINTPNNPTGTLLCSDDMNQLREVTRDTDITIIADEVYQHIIFDEKKHESILLYPDLFQRSIVTMSFGKTFHATGWRIGYAIGPTHLTQELRKVHQYNTFSINRPLQHALADYLQKPERYLSLAPFFQKKRDLFCNNISDSRFQLIPSSGTYFVLASYREISDMPDQEFARWITREHKVAVIPISSFYSDGTDERVIRFCFGKTDDLLIRAAQRIKEI